MKKLIVFIIPEILFLNYSFSQNVNFERFINSFPISNNVTIYDFGKVVNSKNKMSKKEAIDFVYNGDSAKLYCTEQIINMETEKIVGETTVLHIPDKCFKINTGQYHLIGYTSYQCQSIMDNRIWDMIEISLNMLIVDKHYNIRDSMKIFRGNEFNCDIDGLLNPVNKIIFILREKHGYCYKINPQTMKFEMIKEQDNITGATDNLEKVLERLGWKEEFLGKENK